MRAVIVSEEIIAALVGARMPGVAVERFCFTTADTQVERIRSEACRPNTVLVAGGFAFDPFALLQRLRLPSSVPVVATCPRITKAKVRAAMRLGVCVLFLASDDARDHDGAGDSLEEVLADFAMMELEGQSAKDPVYGLCLPSLAYEWRRQIIEEKRAAKAVK